MLSRRDIEKELGKGINIVPFHAKNLKENSINLTIGQNAWTLGCGTIVKRASGKYDIAKSAERKNANVIELKKGQSAIISEKNSKYLVLLPHTTTIIETSEVLSVSNRIGGTFHSKVGVVNQGIGDTSTMLGPCFSGHLMFSLHNINDEIRVLRVGDTFVSLIFYYLNSPSLEMKNPNMSGHVDKLSEMGIQISKATREFLAEEWKQDIKQVSYKMTESKEYKAYVNMRKKEEKKELINYLSFRNILLLILGIVFVVCLAIGSYYLDRKYATNVWSDRFWTVFVAGIFAPLVCIYGKLFRRK